MNNNNMEKLQNALSDGIPGVTFFRGYDLSRGGINGNATVFANITGYACLLSVMEKEKGKSPYDIAKDSASFQRFGSVRGKAMHWLAIGHIEAGKFFCEVAGSPKLKNGKEAAAHVKATVEWFAP